MFWSRHGCEKPIFLYFEKETEKDFHVVKTVRKYRPFSVKRMLLIDVGNEDYVRDSSVLWGKT